MINIVPTCQSQKDQNERTSYLLMCPCEHSEGCPHQKDQNICFFEKDTQKINLDEIIGPINILKKKLILDWLSYIRGRRTELLIPGSVNKDPAGVGNNILKTISMLIAYSERYGLYQKHDEKSKETSSPLSEFFQWWRDEK